MGTELDLRQSAYRCFVELTVTDESQAPGSLRNQNVAAWKKDHTPWAVQTFCNRNDANLLRVGFELQTPALVLSRTGAQNQNEYEQKTNESCDKQLHGRRGTRAMIRSQEKEKDDHKPPISR